MNTVTVISILIALYGNTFATTTVGEFTGTSSAAASVPCPLSDSRCYCSKHNPGIAIFCNYVYKFPVFFNFSDAIISYIGISGNYSTIPNYAFYPLQTLTSATVFLSSVSGHYSQLIMGTYAFAHTNPSAITKLLFNYFEFSSNIPQSTNANFTYDEIVTTKCTFPSTTFKAVSAKKQLYAAGTISTFSSNSFYGVQADTLVFNSMDIRTIDPNAFSKIVPIYGSSLSLADFNNNIIQSFAPFKLLNVTTLNLNWNKCNCNITDYTFCQCNNAGGCSMPLQSLSLNRNGISAIGDNAFTNLPMLNYLDLSYNSLTVLPAGLNKLAASLKVLILSGNKLAEITPNAFPNFHLLSVLNLDGNPMIGIDDGAFYGLTFPDLFFSGLGSLLEQVDLLVTYGMTRVQSLTMQSCPGLHSIQLAEASKLPPTLQRVSFSTKMDVREIAPTVKFWLQASVNNTMDISNNLNFQCLQTIQWMAEFVNCPPYQIKASGTRCSGGGTLTSYLDSLQPSCLPLNYEH